MTITTDYNEHAKPPEEAPLIQALIDANKRKNKANRSRTAGVTGIWHSKHVEEYEWDRVQKMRANPDEYPLVKGGQCNESRIDRREVIKGTWRMGGIS